MKIQESFITGREGGPHYRVSVQWRGFGFDRDFINEYEAEAYTQGLRDFQDAVLMMAKDDDT